MAKALHAIDFLAHSEKHPPQPVCLAFGDESFLRRQVILRIRQTLFGAGDDDFSMKAFEGRTAQLGEVLDELGTMAMFGGQRFVVLEEADEFVTRFRTGLEDYVARPSRGSVLLLDVKSCPASTRLYKAAAASGLVVDCNAPRDADLARWLVGWALQTHQVSVAVPVAEMLVEMIGPELGLLDQEVAKLALSTGDDKKITSEMVTRLVGSWRAKTTWDMIDAAMDGRVVEAMQQVDRLLAAAEVPISILGQISASLRKLAAATRLILQAEAAGHRIPLGRALELSGVKPFVIQKAERQLRRLGRQRGLRLYDWLLEADLDLKGDSAMPPRLILERLIVRLAAPQEARRT